MARASWKYHFYKNEEIKDYIDYLIDSPISKVLSTRLTTITRLNFFKKGSLYTGKYSFLKKFSIHHIGFKVGSFTKTRKPFYFRSKRKKKCYKKILNITFY